jgi:phage baseplate assembly protein W
MIYETIQLDGSDILIDKDGKLILTLPTDLSQNYKVWLETQFESDFRDPNYGFKLTDLFNSNYDNIDELVEFYTIEALLQHPRTKYVDTITVTKLAQGKYSIAARIVVTETEETIEVSFSIEQ